MPGGENAEPRIEADDTQVITAIAEVLGAAENWAVGEDDIIDCAAEISDMLLQRGFFMIIDGRVVEETPVELP
jgi:hypothetical protein